MSPPPFINGKICLVTGSTSGIGKEIAAGLAKHGGSVVLIGRERSRCEAAAKEIRRRVGREDDNVDDDDGGSSSNNNNNNDNINHSTVTYLVADLSLQSSVRNLAREFKERYKRLDILINNAGVFRARRELTEDGIESTFAVNHLAPFLLTNLLIDMLKSSGGQSRIVTTSSIAHRGARIDFDDLSFKHRRYNGISAYGQSKLANILFTKELARRLEGSNVTANCFHPGAVRTGLAQKNNNPWYYRLVWQAGSPFFLSPEKGADTGIYLATSPDLGAVSGKYFVKRREAIPSREARDPNVAARLWAVSEELTGIKT
ncbi:MAG TPA: SDR family oxidoreductase [Nitrososphaera sp.]|nr:SDR family oxidoreductase [Nitrososphaera sp.]